MNAIRKQILLDSLYTHCKCRSATSKEIYLKIQKDMAMVPPIELEKSALELIREYKLTGKNLEFTINKLYDIFFPKTSEVTESTGKICEWNSP
jgi:hypothetical protein